MMNKIMDAQIETTKFLKESTMKKLLQQVFLGEISHSKMVEIINEKAADFYAPKLAKGTEFYPYDANFYYPLFDLISGEHGKNLLISEMDDIINCVQKMIGNPNLPKTEEGK